MKELQEILLRVGESPEADMGILATVVDVKGSGYRLAGARMLIERDGNTIGTVSGGCLEADIIERAHNLTENAAPAIVVYDTTKDDDRIFGLGMGCRGVVRILLEPAAGNKGLTFISECSKGRKRAVMATLIGKTNGAGPPVATRYFFPNGGATSNSHDERSQDPDLYRRLAGDAEFAIKHNRSAAKTYQTTDGELEFFVEVIDPPTSVLIFGAGHDARPLAKIAKELGWRVSIFDHRPALATSGRFPTADEVVIARPEHLVDDIFGDAGAVGVVMTHNQETDRESLFRLLNSKCRYIGVLGPKTRTRSLIDDLRNAGRQFDEARLDVLHAPIGLDIGASTPEGIAVSIVAEVQTVLSGRNGGPLRDRIGSIYDRH